ncbi:hypothetical protein BH09MYX1_BH09MYX1_16910 [soil metagenome]
MKTLAFAITLCLALATAPAFAQTKTEADRLFDEGTALMNDGKFAEACPKIAESVKLDPGVGGMLWLADCFERSGKTYSAWKAFKDAEKLAIDTKDSKGRDKVAQKRAAALEPKLSKLTLVAPSPAPAGLKISCDGKELSASELGTELAIDPGAHTIVMEAPNTKRTEQTVTVPDAGTASVVLVLAKDDKPPPPPTVDDSSPGTPMRIAGGALGGLGLVGVVVGSVFGVIASSKLSQSNDKNHCDDQNTCDATGLDLRAQAKDAALVSTIMFIAGGVALAAGITLFVLAPKSKSQVALVPAVGPGAAFATLVGRF